MIRLQFYADINFADFLVDAAAVLGHVPGVVQEQTLRVVMPAREYHHHAADLNEMVRDYGGHIQAHK